MYNNYSQKKADFLQAVMHEINMLKQHAAPEELSKMDFGKLDGGYATTCIYGQITGDCTTRRAKELMDASCIRVMDFNFPHRGIDIDDPHFNINGAYTGQSWSPFEEGYDKTYRSYRYMSVLEAYIITKDAKNEEVIKYLKGEIDTLIL